MADFKYLDTVCGKFSEFDNMYGRFDVARRILWDYVIVDIFLWQILYFKILFVVHFLSFDGRCGRFYDDT